ncbi:hypothetical protein [Nocardioides sambongensis]|uniref:hypothetical protein n=1 Tax=Nocardioides sambongensis TaxID=2589074 RepID=UPI00112BB76D|nr:hypothetical protein [Nocardioides sambongensis]
MTNTEPVAHPTTLRLLLHLAEMLAAMGVGMLLLGGMRMLAGWTVPLEESPTAWYLLMATDMTIAMVLWMRVRGHGWRETLEMSGAMYVPVCLAPAVVVDLLDPEGFMAVTHILMVVAMAVVLVRHRAHQH